MTMASPNSESSSAVALPMLRTAPVIRAVWPESFLWRDYCLDEDISAASVLLRIDDCVNACGDSTDGNKQKVFTASSSAKANLAYSWQVKI